MKRIFVVFLIALSLPLSAQEDEQPYFSVSSSNTWTSQDKTSIQVSAWNVETLEFRLYRLQDPPRFFSELKDLHQFGGRENKPRRKTPLERFHDWKNDWRYTYRALLRQQLDNDAHAKVSGFLDARRESQAQRRITNFTPLPLLNPQQVVSVWKQYMPNRGGWTYEAVHFKNPGKGMYILEAANHDLRAYTLVIVSDIAMITKQAPGRLLTYVADRASGAPLAGSSVIALANYNTVARLTTDNHGIASAPLVLRNLSNNVENLVVLAHHQNDWAIESPFGFNFGEVGANPRRGLVYTDRPVYRPGHPVNFKTILRQERGLEYSVPTGQIDFKVQDPDGTAIYEKKGLALSSFGTAAGNFLLPADAALGYYSVIAQSPGADPITGGFQVEEYKKPEYEVRVTLAKPRTFEGDPIRASIDARYYFGEPVANAKVNWVAHRSWYFSPIFWRDADSDDSPNFDSEGGDQMEEQTTKLDANGHAEISVPTALGKTDFAYRIEARVTGEGNREVHGAATAIVTRASFVVNLEPDRYVYAPGQSARFHVQARDYDGTPIATKLRLDLVQPDPRDAASPGKHLAGVDGSTGATGEGSVTIDIPRGAQSILARLTAPTPIGRNAEAETYLWIASGDTGEQFTNGQDIQLLPDRKFYQPGDIAKILVVSQSRMDYVLVDVEGRNLDAPQLLHPSAKSFTVEIPVKADYVPNFFLSASAFIGGEMHQGVKRLSVPAADRKLQIEVQPAKNQYKPGEAAEYNVTAKDAAGNPVAAEVSLGVVDEAIYAIQPDRTPDLMSVFYGNLSNTVNTDSSLSYFFSGAAGLQRMRLTSLRPPTALAALKPERLIQPKVRKAFPDTAYWVATLNTGANGQAVAHFDFPDSLTTWRATARGVTNDTRVGSASQKTVVRKNLMVRLVVPRFFTQDDEVVVSAIVHNYLNTAKTAHVALQLDGLDVLEGSDQDVTIASAGDAKVNWRVRPRHRDTVTITAKGLTDEESDAMELRLPVNPRGVKESIVRTGVLIDPSTAFDLAWPTKSAPSGRTLTVEVAPSIASSVFGALDYLTSFPWGCTEQTMSSFLPNLIVSDALRQLKIPARAGPTELNVKVRAGLNRLYEFQHPDGGWGWWPTGDSAIFMTAYVVAGLNQAQDLGQNLKPHTLPRAVKWLRAAVLREKNLDPDLRSYAAYAVRGDIEPVWAQRSKLSPYGLALLGLALDQKHDDRAAQVAATLEASATQDDDTAHWQMDRDPLMEISIDASPEATAYALKLLVHRKPASPLLLKAARWLITHRDEGFWWSSTKQTAMVVYGLTDYLRQTGELNADLTANVTAAGRSLLSQPLTAYQSEHIIAPGESTNERIEISKTGTGRLYWSTRGDFYSTAKTQVDTGTVKLNVVRDYFQLAQSREKGRIVYDLRPLNGPLKVGDLLGVRLTVSGTTWQYTIAEDPIPAGAEFVQRDDLYELRDANHWWNNFYSRREFHDDRAAFFNRYFNSGQTQYFYLLKMTNAGTFHVNPARVWPMYQPTRLASTDATQVVVQ